ncbi:MAG: SDR family NAD(P)-dependent oxidoreductase [Acidobacteriia bacterium]|nr:SDR family NAD(P)-dependent oxidoreductase [Terriglobia bacterium]
MGFLGEGVAVITGAGSGIGRELARQLAAQGSALALADVREAGLAETAALLGGSASLNGGAITRHVLDVANEAAVKEFAQEVEARHGRATLLINCAGVALLGKFEELSLEEFRWLMEINFWGTVASTKYFLPLLRRQPRAHLVNISSVFGLVAAVGQSAYCASKFAVRGFTETLRHELAGTNVGVTCVHPGGINTAIAVSARVGAGAAPGTREQELERGRRLLKLLPEKAAARILRGVERREGRVRIGLDAFQIDWLQRIAPSSYWSVLAKILEDPSASR